MARTLQSKALRRTVESAARRSIAVAARSTSAANVIEYSCMRARSASTRKSGRISGQGFRSGCVDFLPRLAHATREDRARHAAVRITPSRPQFPYQNERTGGRTFRAAEVVEIAPESRGSYSFLGADAGPQSAKSPLFSCNSSGTGSALDRRKWREAGGAEQAIHAWKAGVMR